MPSSPLHPVVQRILAGDRVCTHEVRETAAAIARRAGNPEHALALEAEARACPCRD